MTELNTMWETIALALPYAHELKDTKPINDGQPGAPNQDPKAPLNIGVLSWIEETERLAVAWSEDRSSVAAALAWLSNNQPALDPDAQFDYQLETRTLHNGAMLYLPADIKTARLTAHQIAGIHYPTLREIQQALQALGHKTPIETIRTWKKRGQLPTTAHGYSLATAHERATK